MGKDGTCASQGYTVKGSSVTKHYPVVGDITVTKYTKPAIVTSPSLSGTYEGSVPFILDMIVTFNSDGTMDFDNNVKIAHQEVKCEKVAIKVSDEAVTLPNIQNTGDCMGDALRKQKKDVAKFSIAIDSDDTLTFHSTWPDLKLKKKKAAMETTCSVYAIEGATCGQSDIDCKYVKYAKLAEKSLKDGTCASQGYTVKGSSVTKHYPVVGDITVTKYTKPAIVTSPSLSGRYEGSVPFILDMIVTFNSDGTMDFDNNVKIA